MTLSWYERNKDRAAQKQRNWRKNNPLKRKEQYKRSWIRIKNDPVLLEKQRLAERITGKRRRLKAKVQALRIYSNGDPRCVCCNEKEIKFLTFDHINGGGRKERERTKLVGISFHKELIKKPLRKDIQVLCFNCNCAKGYFGKCPHQDA